ncbi:MAG: hypothetical protein KJ970_17845 [Candidatus Eisenbacteria bacterium]|uniref:Uncharacterized protein n=1 Tax=Eiseniibacteriota bacterium TaxID=2212470 RepID=A0A948W7N4_UNCEI|nr:hypothetical protein [Candidatus Eisenbacteria bacterium]
MMKSHRDQPKTTTMIFFASYEWEIKGKIVGNRGHNRRDEFYYRTIVCF